MRVAELVTTADIIRQQQERERDTISGGPPIVSTKIVRTGGAVSAYAAIFEYADHTKVYKDGVWSSLPHPKYKGPKSIEGL